MGFTGQTKVVDLGGGNTATLRKGTFADVAKAQSRRSALEG